MAQPIKFTIYYRFIAVNYKLDPIIDFRIFYNENTVTQKDQQYVQKGVSVGKNNASQVDMIVLK